MALARAIQDALGSQSAVRLMFEEGTRLKKEHGADKVFDFSLGNPDVEPPPEVDAALRALVAEAVPGAHGYMSNAGFPEVREKLAAEAAREQGVPLEGKHLVLSVGAAGGLNCVLKCALNPGDEVIVVKPYFMEYRAYIANHGGRVVEAATNPDFSLNIEAIAAVLSEKTAALIINSPNNPTGRIYPAESLARLAEVLAAHGRKTGRAPLLIADEPYRKLVYGGKSVPPVLACYPESVVVTSYSKSLSLPGERIGYVAVNPAMKDADAFIAAVIYATRVLGFVNAPALFQRVVGRLNNVSVDVAVYEKRQKAFMRALDGAGIEYAAPEGAFYIWAKVPPRKNGVTTNASDTDFASHLKKFLILGVPGSGFSGPGWLRFAYCVDEKIIEAAAAAFRAAMETW